jgi:RNA polymerase sigma factor (TIGR02999 family)
MHISMESGKGEITVLLERLATGDKTAEDALLPLVYVELHRLAMGRLRSERPEHTLQPTALVHEVYLRMSEPGDIQWKNRTHFFRIAARLMRRILVDYARQRGARKRNDGTGRVPLDDAIAISSDQSAEAVEVDELLERLAEISPRQAQVVEMRFYGGLSEEEISAALGVHARTVRRDWLVARAWFFGQLRRG